MNKLIGLIAISAFAGATPALAQQAMAEVIGQPIMVTTNGVSNTMYLEADGTVRVVTPNGSSVPATWAMQGQNLCLTAGGLTECWAYRPLQAQQAQTWLSSCNSQSTWMAQNVNGTAPSTKGERGN